MNNHKIGDTYTAKEYTIWYPGLYKITEIINDKTIQLIDEKSSGRRITMSITGLSKNFDATLKLKLDKLLDNE